MLASTLHLGPTVTAVGVIEHCLRIDENMEITVDIVRGSSRGLAYNKMKHKLKGAPIQGSIFPSWVMRGEGLSGDNVTAITFTTHYVGFRSLFPSEHV